MDIRGIQFLEDVSWDSARESVVFFAQIGKKKILCAVGKNTLNDYFQTKDTKANALENFKTHSRKIQHVAKKLIAEDLFDDNNEVVIFTEDLV